MSTIVQTINERHLKERGVSRRFGERGTAVDALENVAFFFLTPLLGLAYAIGYGVVGMAAVVCYGLKALGVSCGVFKA